MGGHGLVSKRLVVGAASMFAMLLAGASFAWACTAGAETLVVSPDAARAGQTVTVEGRAWLEGDVKVYMARVNANEAPIPLGTAVTTKANPGFEFPVTLPANLMPGNYQVKASLTHSAGDKKGQTEESRVGKSLLEVAPTAPANPGQTNNPGAQPNGNQTANPGQATNAGQNTTGAVNTNTGQATAGQPATADAPAVAAITDAAPAPVAEAPVPAPAPTAEASAPPATVVPVYEEAWSGRNADTRPSTNQPGLLDDQGASNGSTGLLVGAGFLAVGTVALFAGFTVAMARRRQVRSHRVAGF